jgi:hypothetical protein
VRETTYTLPELVKAAWLEHPGRPLGPRVSLMEPADWRPSFTLTWPGMCFTLDREQSEGNSAIHIFLNTNLTFIIFIHDPEFFLYTYNPQAIPMTTWVLPKARTFHSLSLVETEHREMNLAADPCEEDPAYSFRACVQASLSAAIGCRLPWDLSSRGLLCSDLAQFK